MSTTGQPVLVVDLDGTLIGTDLLWETFWAALSANVARLASVFGGGRARIKARLAKWVELDPAALPYNQAVLQLVREWRAAGGRTALVTASDAKYALAISEHLGLFDEVHGSDGTRNLKGGAKATFLTHRFGVTGYDYVGDSRADLPVWRGAHRAITVGVPARLRRAVEAECVNVEHLQAPSGSARDYFRALRPHQWSKNLLVLLPAVLAHSYAVDIWLSALVGFVAFCMVASSVYLLNDLLDLAVDRAHPRKRYRPLASGAIPLIHGMAMALLLLIGGLLCGLAVGRSEFLVVIVVYYSLTIAYSLVLKRQLIIDIFVLAGLYTIRVIAGGAASDVPLSVWLLAFSMFMFLSLAAVKRQTELVDSVAAGNAHTFGRAYRAEDLAVVPMMAVASGYVSVLVMVLYIDSPEVKLLYENPPLLWGVAPVLLFWISRMVMIAHRGLMHDDPIVFAWKDRISRVCGLIIVSLVISGAFY
ncbi:UbiA family prenyltransferase [Emcibacter sp. SYSU 3D8]|uniref:UbiA family prenyltransferase n=1 Tax=Emcibacter sp. SYSU 3D8 TaxID=3133969 RepID=UPI0031FEA6C6